MRLPKQGSKARPSGNHAVSVKTAGNASEIWFNYTRSRAIFHSWPGLRWRSCLTAPRLALPSSRRVCEARVGRVALRGRGAWQAAATPVQDYPAGSWGPAAAADFLPVTLAGNGHRKKAP